MAYSITVSITRPLAQGVTLAEAVAAGDPSVQVQTGGGDELGQLLRAMDATKDGFDITSVQRVEQGTALVERAGETMTEVVASVRRVTDIMRWAKGRLLAT